MQILIIYTTSEWPEKRLIPTDLLLRYTHRSDIIFCGGILLKNERIIEPTTLRLIIDYYSKFIVIEMMKNLQSSTVMNKCKKVLSQFGTPKELVWNRIL